MTPPPRRPTKDPGAAGPERLSFLELRGLGKEAWDGIDAAEHVRRERESWGSEAADYDPPSTA